MEKIYQVATTNIQAPKTGRLETEGNYDKEAERMDRKKEHRVTGTIVIVFIVCWCPVTRLP